MSRLCFVLFSACLWAAPADDARKVLTDAAHNKEGDQRRQAALALSLVPAKDPVMILIETLVKDSDYQVRVAAVDTLGEMDNRSRVNLLKTALGDDVPEVAFAAAKALYNMGETAGLQALEAIYEGETRGRSSYLKKEVRDSWRRLKTPRSAFFFVVQHGVGFVPVPGVGAGYNALLAMLSDSDLSARAVSLLTVCAGKTKICDEMLVSSFADDDWTVRGAAVHIVTARNLTAMKPKIAALIADKKNKVRLRAAAAYLKLATNRPGKSPSNRPWMKPNETNPIRF